MKRHALRRTALLASLAAAVVLLISVLGTASAYAESNLEAAKAKYGITQVIEVQSVREIAGAFASASAKATPDNRAIVHIPDGNYAIDSSFSNERRTVPANVLLVAEPNAVFTAKGSGYDCIFIVAGSVFGGRYDGEDAVTTCLKYAKKNFSGKDGIIENVVVKNAYKEGILAMREGCRNAQVLNCDVSDSGENGISCMDGAYIALIDSCKTYKNGFKNTTGQFGSGINLSHADVGIISNCTISNNADKAVSTNSDPGVGYKQPGCTINAIRNCTINNNKTNGVYIKPKCTLNSFTGNKLAGNKDGIVASGKTAAGTTGKSVIKNVAKNTFATSKNGQITASDKGATIIIKDGNKVTNGKNTGIYAVRGGVVNIAGNKNVISGNKDSAIYGDSSARIYISGSDNKITKSKAMGLYLKGKSQVQITGKNNQVTSNKAEGICAKDSSKIIVKGANTVVKGNGSSGIYLAMHSQLTFTGKNGQITGNKAFGLYARNKSKATLKKVKFAKNKKKAVYTKSGSVVIGGPKA